MRRNHGEGIMGEESLERNGKEIKEEESWERIHGIGIIEEKSWERNQWERNHGGGIMGGIWEASGRHLGGIFEASGSIWEASGRHLGPRGSMRGKCAKSIVFYSVFGRDRPFRARVAKVTLTIRCILHAFSAHAPQPAPPQTSHQYPRQAARTPPV